MPCRGVTSPIMGVVQQSHPKVLRSRTKLVRGVVIWVAPVLALRALDVLFLP